MKDTLLSFFEELGKHFTFMKMILRALRQTRFEGREFFLQFASVSIRSLPTTLTAGLFVGAILAIQFFLQIKDFGAESVLGGLNTSGTLREVGPILIAFMLAGKVGAFTSAEIATMKITDQIDALRCLGIDPVAFLIIPRFLAVTLSSVLLLIFALMISISGGILAAYFTAEINPMQYLSTLPRFTTNVALVLSFVKALVFGVLMGHLSCAHGYWTTGGTEGVGVSVRRTAVQSMVAIVLSDFMVSWIIGNLHKALGGA